jgi:hypothetical protein
MCGTDLTDLIYLFCADKRKSKLKQREYISSKPANTTSKIQLQNLRDLFMSYQVKDSVKI